MKEMMDEKTFGVLRELGLNEYQAKAFYILHSTGQPKTAGEISVEAKIPRPRVYDVLDSLHRKNYVASHDGRPVKYKSLSLEEISASLKAERQAAMAEEIGKIESLVGKLKTANVKAASPAIENAVWTFRGRNAIYSKMDSMIQGANSEVVFASGADALKSKVALLTRALKNARKRNVEVHFVSKLPKNSALSGEATKIWGKHIPTRMLLADDEALLMLTGGDSEPDEEIGLWLKSPHLVETLKKTYK